jgi:hypothetical protein
MLQPKVLVHRAGMHRPDPPYPASAVMSSDGFFVACARCVALAGGFPGGCVHVDLLAAVDLPHGGAVVRGLRVQELVLFGARSVLSSATLLVGW